MLNNLKLIHERDAHDALGQVERYWREQSLDTSAWTVVVPTKRNQAKQIALEVIGKTPVLYSGSILSPVALHWKRGFNQHAKHLAWTSEYPDHLETELTGWTKQPVYKPYVIIDLQTNFDDQQTKQAFIEAKRLLSGRRPAPIAVDAAGDSLDAQIAWATALGDYVAVYTAILCNVNPSSKPLADKLKE